MKVFLALVRNDTKFGKADPSYLNRMYFAVALFLGQLGLTWATRQGFINSGFVIWCFLISIPYVNASYLLNKEWQEGTTGWWLTLPYSKNLLLSAKCVASFWRVLKIYAIFFVTTQIMMLLYNSMLPNFLRDQQPQLLDLLQACAKDLSWLLIISPFSIMLGGLMIIMARSHWLPSATAFWAGFGLGLLTNLYVAKALGFSSLSKPPSVHFEHGYFLSVNGSDFFTTLLISLTISALLFVFSVYLLNRHVEV